MLVRHYDWAGYDVLAITDHWVRTVERVDERAARDPVDRAERRRRRRRGRARARARARGRPGAPPEGFEPLADVVAWIAANGGVPYLAHTYWSGLRTELWWDCEGLSGSRSGTRAASSSSGAATRRSTGTRRSSTGATLQGARDRRLPPSRATTAASRGRGSARRSGRRPAVLEALRAGAFYGSTGPAIRAVEVSDDEVDRRVQPRREPSRSTAAAGGCARERRPPRLPEPQPRPRRANDDGLITSVALQRPWDGGRYGRVEVKARRRDEGLDEPAVDRVAAAEQLGARRSTCS